MKIEIWSDIMCPFCYIGKRRLESALKDFESSHELEVEWKSFLLNPDMKTDPTKNSLQYLSEMKGWTMEQTIQATQQVTQMAKEEGLTYRMESTKVANARDAHRLIQLAKTYGKGDAMEERLFKSYFTEGENIADYQNLVRLGTEVGLDSKRIQSCLENGEFLEEVDRDIDESRQIGVRGVPFFVFNHKYAISGAQPKSVFEQTIQKAWEEYSKSRPELEITNQNEGSSCTTDGNCD